MDVTFHMLALDVLSGRPEPRGSAPDLVDSYEVWGYRHDPNAVAIIRSFDAGAAVACAAFLPEDLGSDERFLQAVERLVELRIPGSPAGSKGKLSDLELLEPVPAFERIARALALDVERKGFDTHPAVAGAPSDATLDYLETLQMLDPFADEDEGSATPFESLAVKLLEEPERLRWTGARERSKDERIEVLVHVADPAATVLVHFSSNTRPPTVAAYLPPFDDDATHDKIIDDIRAMVAARSLDGTTAMPLPNNGPFRRLGNDRALAQIGEILDDIEAGAGCQHDFLPAPDPNVRDAPDAEPDGSEGTRKRMH